MVRLTGASHLVLLPRILGMSRSKKPDALQGTLDLLVLKTLSRGPHHGYAIAAHIQQVTTDALRVEEGSLYPALHRMDQAGWIAAHLQQLRDGSGHRLTCCRSNSVHAVVAAGQVRRRIEPECCAP